MPELPEVETTLRGISPYIEQQKITDVIVRHTHLRWLIPVQLKKLLLNKKLLKIKRRAKYLLFYFENASIIIHLGMSGHLRVLTHATHPKKHDHVDLVFSNHCILRLNDPRRFGALLFVAGDPLEHRLLKNLGVEPLSRQFNVAYLLQLAKKSKLAIKIFIMNQKVVTGVGNIYATEALFAAGIHPLAPAHTLSAKKLERLIKHIKRILQQAIRGGGTTLKDFLNSDGKPGYFSLQLKVYGRQGLPCFDCYTPLHTLTIGQRNTVYCPKCQRQV